MEYLYANQFKRNNKPNTAYTYIHAYSIYGTAERTVKPIFEKKNQGRSQVERKIGKITKIFFCCILYDIKLKDGRMGTQHLSTNNYLFPLLSMLQ